MRRGRWPVYDAYFVPFGPRGSTVWGRHVFNTTLSTSMFVPYSFFGPSVLVRFRSTSHSAFVRYPATGLTSVWVGTTPGLPIVMLVHSTHAHSAEADVATARGQNAISSETALFVIVLSLPCRRTEASSASNSRTFAGRPRIV